MSVREIEKNKRYQIEVVTGYNGKKKIRQYEMFYGGKKGAILRENEIKSQIKNNTYINKNKKTVAELLKEYLEYNKNKWAIKTYKSNLNWVKVINEQIGFIKLQDLNIKVLEKFYTYLRTETNYADKTIQHFYVLINGALNKAVMWGYLLQNINSKIEKPKARKKEIKCYSPEEVEELLDAVRKECLKYQAIIFLALDSGIRRGELTGLKWEDVDFENATISINKITQYVSGYGIYEKETKTDTSDRRIYISEYTLNILKKFQKEQKEKKLLLGDKWGNSKRIFTTEFGDDMHPDTPSKILKKIIKKYKLKTINFHALRHTSISLMISKGVQSQIISKKAGHSSVEVTHSIYSHFFDDEFKSVANIMNDILQVKSI